MSISESLAPKIPNKLKPPLRVALRTYLCIYRTMVLISPLKPFKVAKFRKYDSLKLNVGCGEVKFPKWVNIDIEPGADLVMDVRKGIPFDDGSIDFIYSEHFLEHLTFKEGQKVLKEFNRCLRNGSYVRIAMPDLDYVIQKYNADWENQDWLSWPEYKFIRTRGRMINVAFRSWGHKYLYNEEDLRKQLIEAGFHKIRRCESNKSNYIELAGLETREDSKLVMEAVKRDI